MGSILKSLFFVLVIAAATISDAGIAAAKDAEVPDPGEHEVLQLEDTRDQHWYLIVALANVWPRLEESEAQIDRDVNDLLGNLLPRWDEPTTFRDWRDDLKLWDIQIGLGRSLNDRWSVFVTAGGIAGSVTTENAYRPLLFPLHIRSKFRRKVWFASAGVDYYPWTKVDYDPNARGNWFTRRIRAARPYVQAATGYVHVRTEGEVRFRAPVLGNLAKVTIDRKYDLCYLSPRIGLDIPVTERGNFALMAGYLFFMQHPREFDTASFYFMYKHRL